VEHGKAGRLRIGGLAEGAATPAATSAGPLFELTRGLAGEAERVRGGVWLRQLELLNPEPPEGADRR